MSWFIARCFGSFHIITINVIFSTVTAFLTISIIAKITLLFENFRNTSDSEPSAKKRKTTTAVAVADQSGQNSKILIDSMSDNIMDMDEVTNCTCLIMSLFFQIIT